MELLKSRPTPPVSEGMPTFYGLGWHVRPLASGTNIWHHGSLPGTRAIVLARWDGTTLVATFNSRSTRERDDELGLDLDRTLTATTVAVNDAKAWPEHDLFGQYP